MEAGLGKADRLSVPYYDIINNTQGRILHWTVSFKWAAVWIPGFQILQKRGNIGKCSATFCPLKGRKIEPPSMATAIVRFDILLNSRYEDN